MTVVIAGTRLVIPNAAAAAKAALAWHKQAGEWQAFEPGCAEAKRCALVASELASLARKLERE